MSSKNQLEFDILEQRYTVYVNVDYERDFEIVNFMYTIAEVRDNDTGLVCKLNHFLPHLRTEIDVHTNRAFNQFVDSNYYYMEQKYLDQDCLDSLRKYYEESYKVV